jgi:hypothetical protein
MHVEEGQSLGHGNVDVKSTRIEKKNRRVKIRVKQSIIIQTLTPQQLAYCSAIIFSLGSLMLFYG